ncbi:MAG: PAS domain S-box protein [Geobacteraceae bacterium]|nr:PAS domain S-box protein [Geobacteraceae bacterium]
MNVNLDYKDFISGFNPFSPDLNWVHGSFEAVLILLGVASVAAIRFSRISTRLRNTITDNKRVGDALLESESLYRSILNASPDDITITDIEGNIKMVSPAGVAMFGYEQQDEFLGHNIVDYISPEDRDRFLSYVKGLFSGVGEYRALRSDGSTFDIETNGQFIRNAEGLPTSMVYVIRDITERKQAGHSCRVAMGEMISAIAHQWRQPLATLGMIVQRTHAMGTMQKLTEDSMDEFKTSAMRQIRYMSDTIDEFRNFPHPGKHKELFSPLSCINDAVCLFGSQLINNCITVDFQCQGFEERLVNGSPKEFKQVILNLLGNARDAILESRSANGKPEEGFIRVLMSINAGNYLTIDISDNGCGIAPEIAQRILEPYFTTKEENGGTGLGLYMSRMIVEEGLGGRFRQISSSEGATFRIELLLEKPS